MTPKKFECRICFEPLSESAILGRLQKAMPSMQWEEGDSSWDKIRVWGGNVEANVSVYRYESPGPFSLTISILQAAEDVDAEQVYVVLRDRVIAALGARLWKPLEAQPVTLVKPQGRFPSAYDFECDLTQREILRRLEDADHWYWELGVGDRAGSLVGRVAFRLAGQTTRKIRYISIGGESPSYTVTVGNWDQDGMSPTCDEVHETVQRMILPAIGARTARAAARLKPVRPPRVRITYPCPSDATDTAEDRELPFVVGVIADLSGQPETKLPSLKDRQFVDIDSDNFAAVLARIAPRLSFRVDNLDIELRFQALEDFEPHAIALQVERQTLPDRSEEIDAEISRFLDNILRAPELQKLEAAWRGLHLLVSRTETCDAVQIKVLNASRKDLLRDLQRAVEFDQSGLFKLLYDKVIDRARPSPFGMLVSDLTFGIGSEDVDLLSLLSSIAAAIHAPLLAAAGPGFFSCDTFAEVEQLRDPSARFFSPNSARWKSYRKNEDARYVGLTVPGIRLRSSHGENELWGSAAWALASLVTRSGGLDNAGQMGDLTLECALDTAYTGESGAVDATESASRWKLFAELGLIPCVPVSGAVDTVAFPRMGSTQVPPVFDNAEATINHRQAAELPYVFAISRFAHYIQAILRDRPEPFASPTDCENALNIWISQYVTASGPWSAARPLGQARIEIATVSSGLYRAVVYAYPAYQVALLPFAIRTTVHLTPGKINPATPLRSAQSWVEEANTLATAARYEEALTAIGHALDIDAKHNWAWRQKVFALGKLKRFAEQQAALDAGLKAHPGDAWLWQKKTEVLEKLERWDEALAAVNNAIHIDPTPLTSWRQKVFALGKLQRRQEQLAAADAGLMLYPHDGWLWHHKTEILEKLERWEEALEAAEHALEFKDEPADWHYKHHKARALNQLRRLDEALKIYQEVIAANPQYAEAWAGKADVLDRMGRWDEALTVYDKVVAMPYGGEAFRANREALVKRIAFIKAGENEQTKAPGQSPRVSISYEAEVAGCLERIELPFVAGVLADLSGARAEPLPGLADRMFVRIDQENFDRVLASACPRVKLQEFEVTLKFRSLADFDPDAIASQIPPLEKLLTLRDGLIRLKGTLYGNDRFEAKLEQILRDPQRTAQVLGDLKAVKESGATPGPLVEMLFKETGVTSQREDPAAAAKWLLASLEDAVRGDVTRGDCEAVLTARVAILDGELSRQLDEAMHHPDLQRLEATWRGLRYFVDHFADNPKKYPARIDIRVLNVSKSELWKEFEAAELPEQSAIFKKIYEEPYYTSGEFPFSLLIGDYYFDHGQADLKLLAGLAEIARAAHAPFLTAPEMSIFDGSSLRNLKKVRDAEAILVAQSSEWKQFRKSEAALYTGLALPRVLLRLPHSKYSVERFAYEERITKHEHCLWGNATFAVATRITDSFARFGWFANLQGREGGAIGALPVSPEPFDDLVDERESPHNFRCPIEAEIDDRYNVLSKLGYITLNHLNDGDFAVILATPSCYQPETPNEQGYAVVELRFVLALCRFAHYLRWMTGDAIGGFASEENVGKWLNAWIQEYVLEDDAAGPELRVARPLKSAGVKLIPEASDLYQATLRVQPRYQLPDVENPLQTVVRLSRGGRNRPPPAPKPVVQRYEILRLLGGGGIGVVNLATDHRQNRSVVLKMMRPDAAWTAEESAGFRSRFEREATARAGLQHPNLVPFLDRGEIDGCPYMALAFVEGQTVEAMLERRGKVSLEEAVRILRPVADALDYGHAKEVIHRDVRPWNILVQRDGHVFLLDCGLAKVLNPRADENPDYMAPELQGGILSKSTDQWCLGVVAHRMLTGRAWVKTSLVDKILRKEPAYSRVVAKALSTRPESRYAKCGEFVDALELLA